MRVFVAGATGVIGGPLVAQLQSIAFAYAPTSDRVKEEDAALFTDAPPPVGGLVAAIVEHEERVTGTPDTPEMSLRGASNAKAKRDLGWRPRYASWREGFAASLA